MGKKANAVAASVAILLILVVVSGPFYVFFWASCASTRSCVMGALLFTIGAECAEGDGERSEGMQHGETCTLMCGKGYIPNTPQLICMDGVLEGASESLACAPPVFFDNRALAGGFVSGAVLGGDVLSACNRAKNIECSARSGGSAILLQLSGLTFEECEELFDECQSLNDEFEYMQHTVDPDTPSLLADRAPGTCTLGCFEEIMQDFSRAQYAERTEEETDIFEAASAGDALSGDACEDGPICIEVTGSCNEADNGDYYRFPTCASSFTQWVMPDASRRLRYDGIPAYSQMGKWVLEQGADPNLDNYGLELARQRTYLTTPDFGDNTMWRVRCRKQIDSLTFQETFEWRTLILGACSCTDEQDCSGNGMAFGDKESGPNCKCNCDTGFAGDHCEFPLCKAPDVLFGPAMACAEGDWLTPGQACTLQCNPGYQPSYASIVCGADGRFPPEQVFECIQKVSSQDEELILPGMEEGSTTLAPCTDMDCSFRGTPTGSRQRDGTCRCLCFANFTGDDCKGWVGSCQAPRPETIENAYITTCEEGLTIDGSTCTTRCLEGYVALPSSLECMGLELVPPTFRCISTSSFSDIWCETMRYIAISSSVVAAFALAMVCFCYGKTAKREVQAVVIAGQLVQVGKDNEGKYGVVKPDALEERKYPRGIMASKTPALAITNQAPVSIDDANHAIDNGNVGLAITSGVVAADVLKSIKEDGGRLRRIAQVAAETGARAALEAGPLMAAPEDYYPNELQEQQPPRALLAPVLFDESRGDGEAALVSMMPLPGALEGDEYEEDREDHLVVYDGGAGGEMPPQTPSVIEQSGRFRPGQQVSLCGLVGHQALNGVQGSLVEFDSELGMWIVSLEGFENELKQIPERNLQEIQLAIHDATRTRSAWHFEMHALNERADASRREQAQEARELKAMAAAAVDLKRRNSLTDTASQRETIENDIREAFATANIEALRDATKRAKKVLEEIQHCPASDRASLIRLVENAEGKLEQFDAREEARAAKRRHQDRIDRGEAPDWKMTQKQFWQHAEAGRVEKVNAGLKSKMSLAVRTTDGNRHTIMHLACKRVCADAIEGGAAAEARLATLRALIEAKANPNAVDESYLAPLDLALAEGGEQVEHASVVEILETLRSLGMRTASEEAAELRKAASGGRGGREGGAAAKAGAG